jgi:hypothetical protein
MNEDGDKDLPRRGSLERIEKQSWQWRTLNRRSF